MVDQQPSKAGTPRLVLLGPQPDGERQVGQVLAELGIRGPVALITAGWQEYESEDLALRRHLRVRAHNLGLHARSETLFAADPDFAAAHKARQSLLRQIQAFYRVRLECADDAAKAIAVRHVSPELLDAELAVSIDVFRHLDRDHVERCRQVHAEFVQRHRPHARPEIARHRAEVARLVADSEAVVIGGGHVASLLSRLHLFGLPALLAGAPERPIVAWSAGAMALTDRVVCFHDFPPYGKDVAQVLETGLGLAPGVVIMPDPQRRVRLDDAKGIARFARRMAPAHCFGLDAGSALWFDPPAVAAPRAGALSPTTTQFEMAAYGARPAQPGPTQPGPAQPGHLHPSERETGPMPTGYSAAPPLPRGQALLLTPEGAVEAGWSR